MSALYFIVMIGVLIFVHEFGHFTLAKLFGVKVLRFSIGFGPRMFGFVRGETEYVIAWLPLGGFVNMLGQDPMEEVDDRDQERAFFNKPLWQRFLIVFAGPAVNLVFPIAIYFVFFFSHTVLPPAIVGAVFPGTPAAKAGMQPGDQILSIDGEEVRYWFDLQQLVGDAAGQRLTMLVARGKERLQVTVTPEEYVAVSRLGRERRTGRVGIASHYLGSQLGVLGASSPAAEAGLETWDRVTAINGEAVDKWIQVEDLLQASAGRVARLTIQRTREGEDATSLEISLTVPEGGNLRSAGLFPGEFFVRSVEADSPAAGVGLQVGDMLVAVDGRECAAWDACAAAMLERADKPHEVAFISAAHPELGPQQKSLMIEVRKVIGEYKEEQQIAVFGAQNRPLTVLSEPIPNVARFSYALSRSVRKNLEVVSVTLYGFAMIMQGRISSKSLGGPIMIYNIAGKAAEKGWDEFLWVMALISINLGVINLLPIPMLDGGHVLFILIEAVKRKPLSLRSRAIATYVGLSMLLFLMLFAFKNDIERYWDDIAAFFR